MARGSRTLILSASGAGKSTLAALLCAFRAPTGRTASGVATLVPQAHDNHISQASLAFNLFVGGRWPPDPTDVRESDRITRALFLGDIMDRMPMGIAPPVGECGWPLSDGERARVQLARALIHDARTIVLDESLAALDPLTLETILAFLDDRTETLVIITRP